MNPESLKLKLIVTNDIDKKGRFFEGDTLKFEVVFLEQPTDLDNYEVFYDYILVPSGDRRGEPVLWRNCCSHIIKIPTNEKGAPAEWAHPLAKGVYNFSVECRATKTESSIQKGGKVTKEYSGRSSTRITIHKKEDGTGDGDGPDSKVGALHEGEHYSKLQLTRRGNLPVELQRTGAQYSEIVAALAKNNSKLFLNLQKYLDVNLDFKGNTPFQGVDAYEDLRFEVDQWMRYNLSTDWDANQIAQNLVQVYGTGPLTSKQIQDYVEAYFLHVDEPEKRVTPSKDSVTPYLENIVTLHDLMAGGLQGLDNPDGAIRDRLVSPALCELIWSYWHEEGMLVQTMQAINLRFQNKLQRAGKDPLASLNTSPLRPLSNLLWGYIQSEPDRLSVRRRNYEYDHHYGIFLHGKAVQDFTPADSRKTFMGAFNQILYLLTKFYKEKDDTTIYADAFPIRNALREIHLILSEGAHNQFGDLPWTARVEMYIEQYILGRKEMREFLGGRSMVPYTEPWMENADTMKRIQGWTDVSVQQFNTLARTGEEILLGIRFGEWNNPAMTAQNADNWAMLYRNSVQEYIHSYRSVTGIDLTDQRQVDDAPPTVHLRRKLEAQTGKPS